MATFEYKNRQVDVKAGRTVAETLPEVKEKFSAIGVTIPANCVVRTGGYPCGDDFEVDDNLFVITDN